MATTTKKGTGPIKSWNWFDRSSTTQSWHSNTSTYADTYELTSESHPDWQNSVARKGDVGGNFFLKKVTNDFVGTTYIDGDYTRGFITVTSLSTEPSLSISEASNSELDAWGTTAIARTLPTNPVFDASTFLGEVIKDGMPSLVGSSLWRDKTLAAKNAGHEYLNVVFGWQPLVADIKDLAYAVKNYNRVLNRYRKGSDKPIHVRYDFPTTTQTVTSSGNSRTTPNVTHLNGQGTITRTYTRKVWFEGCYRYHIPVGNSQLGKLSELEAYANKLLGLRLDPETVWNLTPWSWAVDWFSNTGDVVRNVSSLGRDGLVLQYGYIMCNTKRVTTRTCYNPSYGTLVRQDTIEYKQRRAATPYGFGFNLNGLTVKQSAILAALGMTKGSRPWGSKS